MIVRSQEANYLEVSFRSILLKLADQKARQLRPFLRVTVSHGSSWSGKERAGGELLANEESTTLVFHSLLDTVVLQLYNDKARLCEAKRFLFELIGDGSRILELEGEIVKRASIKLVARSTLPIVIIE
jgi:hypothetical protein